MYAQVEKPKENKSRAAAYFVGQKKSNSKRDAGFVDNRLGSITQRKLQINMSKINLKSKAAEKNIVIQQAGDPQGMMVKHTDGEMTFHHIVPENRLHVAWDKIKDMSIHNTDKSMKSGFSSLVDKGYVQIYEAAKKNILTDMKIGNCEPQDFKNDKYPTENVIESKIRLLGVDSVTTKTITTDLMKEGQWNDYKIEVNKIIGVNTKAITNDEGEYQKKDTVKDKNTPIEANTVLKQFMMWIPGNIHRGPTSRLTPGDDGWDAARDDGGSAFETSASKVVAGGHYTALEEFNSAVEAIIEAPSEESLTTFNNKLEALTAYDMTEYNETKWEQQEDEKWRLK